VDVHQLVDIIVIRIALDGDVDLYVDQMLKAHFVKPIVESIV
jgi:hypothetical protein